MHDWNKPSEREPLWRVVQPMALNDRVVSKLLMIAATPGHHMYTRVPAWPKRPRESNSAASELRSVTAIRNTMTRYSAMTMRVLFHDPTSKRRCMWKQ